MESTEREKLEILIRKNNDASFVLLDEKAECLKTIRAAEEKMYEINKQLLANSEQNQNLYNKLEEFVKQVSKQAY